MTERLQNSEITGNTDEGFVLSVAHVLTSSYVSAIQTMAIGTGARRPPERAHGVTRGNQKEMRGQAGVAGWGQCRGQRR